MQFRFVITEFGRNIGEIECLGIVFPKLSSEIMDFKKIEDKSEKLSVYLAEKILSTTQKKVH